MDEGAFLEAVDRCYSALAEPDGMDSLVRFLCRQFSARAGDVVTEAVGAPVIQTHGSAGFDDSFRTSYDADFLGDNPWVESLRRLPRGRVHGEAAETDDYWDSAYYNEWVRPQGLRHSIGAILDASPEHHTWVGFAREAGLSGFGEEAKFLERLIPHLRRATGLSREISTARQRHAGIAALIDILDFPVLVVDRVARLIEANRAGQTLLDRPGPLWLSGQGRISAQGAAGNAELRGAIARSGAVMATPESGCPAAVLLDPPGGPALVVDVMPLRCDLTGYSGSGCVGLFVHDLAARRRLHLHALVSAHGLTETECDLAQWLASGRSLRAFAEARGVAIGTARWHLKNIEQKTGARRVEELVALIHRSALPLRFRSGDGFR